MKSYYQVLGMLPTATKSQIRKAYLALTRRYHSDVGGDRSYFEEITQAYRVLSDDRRRKEYDAQRAIWLAKNNFLDCPNCGTTVRKRGRGYATHCGHCKHPLTTETIEGTLKRKGYKAVQGVADVAQDLAEDTVGEMAKAAGDFIRAGFAKLRARYLPQTRK